MQRKTYCNFNNQAQNSFSSSKTAFIKKNKLTQKTTYAAKEAETVWSLKTEQEQMRGKIATVYIRLKDSMREEVKNNAQVDLFYNAEHSQRPHAQADKWACKFDF